MGCNFSETDDKCTQPRQLTTRHRRSGLIDPRKKSTKYTDIVTENTKIIKNKLDKKEA